MQKQMMELIQGIDSVALASDLVDDTSPQLGGNLDTNSFMIDFDDLTVLEMKTETNNYFLAQHLQL